MNGYNSLSLPQSRCNVQASFALLRLLLQNFSTGIISGHQKIRQVHWFQLFHINLKVYGQRETTGIDCVFLFCRAQYFICLIRRTFSKRLSGLWFCLLQKSLGKWKCRLFVGQCRNTADRQTPQDHYASSCIRRRHKNWVIGYFVLLSAQKH